MKFLVIPLLIFNTSVIMANGKSTASNDMLTDLLICKVKWNDLNNNHQTSERIMGFIESNFHRKEKIEGLVPNKSMRVFDSTVLWFKTGFGMSPGFSASLDSDFNIVKHIIENKHSIAFDECQNKQCYKAYSDTETFVLLEESGKTFAGCMYPYMR